jgi:DNA-binding NarL/FixJ family response regulator
MNNLSSSVNNLEWRHSKLLELSSQGYTQLDIARTLQISQSSVNRDLAYIAKQLKRT